MDEDGDYDPADVAHWPEGFLFSGVGDEIEEQLFSIVSVENGMKCGDLNPLAEHLRRGRQIPRELAEMLADAIEGAPEALCRISAKRLKAGNHSDAALRHGRYTEIGQAAERELRKAKPGEYDAAMKNVAKAQNIGTTTAYKAHRYLRLQIAKWGKMVE